MNKLLLTLLALLTAGGASAQHHQHGHHHGNDSTAGSANAYMHQSSTEQLVQRFEGPERDAYQQPEKVLDLLGSIEGKTIMDIGAGSGYFSVKLAARGAHVIAADVSEELQAYLRERIAKDRLQDIELRLIPYDSPALKDAEVDLVFLANTYHHIEDRTAYFRQVRQGTKPGGELVIVDFFKADLPVGPPVDHKVALDTVITELKEAGYTSFQVEVDRLPYQYIVRAR